MTSDACFKYNIKYTVYPWYDGSVGWTLGVPFHVKDSSETWKVPHM